MRDTAEERAKRTIDERARGKARAKSHEQPLGEEQGPLPRREQATTSLDSLACWEVEESGKGVRDTEQLDRDQTLGWGTGIAREPLVPAKAIMRPLRPRKERRQRVWAELVGQADLDFYPLVAQELHASAAMLSAAPISPQERGRTHLERMEQHTDLARLFGGAALPLTVLPQGAGAAAADAGCIHHTQAAIAFGALFLRKETGCGWTVQGAVRLEGKVVPREATCFPGQSDGGWAIAHRGGGVPGPCGGGGSKLGGAQRGGRELMTQFQAQVPDPL